jgi:hypothetical protein
VRGEERKGELMLWDLLTETEGRTYPQLGEQSFEQFVSRPTRSSTLSALALSPTD